MSVRKTIVWCALLAVAGPGSASGQNVGGLGVVLPSQRVLSQVGLERAWWSQAVLDPARDRIAYLTMDEDNVYVQSSAGVVTAFDAELGKQRWAVQVGPVDMPSQQAVSNDEFVLVISGTMMYCLQKFTGEMLWKIPLPEPPSTSPAMDEKHAYIGFLTGAVYAYDLQTIREFYESNQLPEFAAETIQWKYQTGRLIPFPPVSVGRVVNFASLDRSLYSLGRIDRELIWQFETDSTITAPLAPADGGLLLAVGQRLFFIRSETGQVRWPFTVRNTIRAQPRVVGDDVFVASEHAGFYCLSLANGNTKWPWRPHLQEFLAASATRVVAADTLGNLFVLSRADGTIQSSISLRRYSLHISNDRTDRLYLATPGGQVMCLREIGAEFPQYHKYPERSPLLPEFAPEVAPDVEPAPQAPPN